MSHVVLRWRFTPVALMLAAALTSASAFSAVPPTPSKAAALKTLRLQKAAPLTPSAAALVHWVQSSRDNAGAPFAVIDKRQARLWLFDASGKRIGSTAVLLGLAHGDLSVPGIGEREMSRILPQERTTPAGRFVTEVGRNSNGEDIFWVDYDAAVSMHRVRATNPAERRIQRLATPTPADNRISYGCINVPAAFYGKRIQPLFAREKGIVYLLPETLPMAQFFGAASALAQAEAKPNAKADPRQGKGPLRKV